MAITQEYTVAEGNAGAGQVAERRKGHLVTWFAVAGAAAIALQLYVYGRWIASGPTRTPNGATPVPRWMELVTHGFEIASVVVTLIIGYYLVVRPLRRDGRLHWDSYFFFALLLLYWQDPWSNMFRHWFWYNTAFFQWGSWLDFMPFVQLPNAGIFPEPVIASGPAYVWWDVPNVFLACALMRACKDRWPRLGLTGQWAIGFVWLVAIDLILESLVMRAGYYGYTAGWSWLTFDAGHYYQLPVGEPVAWGLAMFLMAAMRYHRDDKGRSFFERGVDDLHVTRKQRGWIRMLAFAGFFNLSFAFLYNLPAAIYTIGSAEQPWPQEVEDRTYMNAGMCGAGTDHPCHDADDTPLPLSDRSIYINNEGEPVYPPGNKFAPSRVQPKP